MEDYVELVANIENERAMRLRDRGDITGAQRVFISNSAYLNDNAEILGGSSRLGRGAAMNDKNAREAAAPAAEWNRSRKGIIEVQNRLGNQQSY
jgi:hypothetical protein